MLTDLATMSPARARSDSLREVALLAYPVVLQTLSDTLMQVVDSAMVGQLGATELGGVGFGGIWLWTLLVAFFGTGTGVQTFVAQAYGAQEPTRCGHWLWQGLYTLVPLAAVWAGVIALVFEGLLTLLGPSVELQAIATSYVHARLYGAPAVIIGIVLASFFRGLGDTRTPLLATVAGNLFNLVFTYGLVFGRFGLPAWGAAGAGAATAMANWVFVTILATAAMRPRVAGPYATHPQRPELHAMRRFVWTSAPIGGQWLLDMASFAVFSTLIARMGDVQMAASQAMIQLLSLSFMQAYGISTASGALVGRYIGARDLDAAERTHRAAMQLGIALALVVGALFLAVPDLLLRLFSDDAAVFALGRPLLALGALFQLIDALGIIASGALRGAGDTRWPFVMQASLAWAVRLPVVYLFAILLDGGLFGAWFGELLYVGVLAVAWTWRFRSGVWRDVRI